METGLSGRANPPTERPLPSRRVLAGSALLLGVLTACTARPALEPAEPTPAPTATSPATVRLLEIETTRDGSPVTDGTVSSQLAAEPYVERLPGNRLRVVASGNGCRTWPVAYDPVAPEGTLALLSSPSTSACTDNLTFTTTVVRLPEGYERAKEFMLDGEPAELLDTAGFTVTAEDGTRLLFAQPASAGDAAEVDGTLIRTDGGCVGLRQDDGVLTVIWPHGTRFDGTRGIRIPGVGAVRFGDRVEGGGGYYDLQDVADRSRWLALETCETGDDFAGIWFDSAG